MSDKNGERIPTAATSHKERSAEHVKRLSAQTINTAVSVEDQSNGERSNEMQEAIETVLDFLTKWLITYFAICGSIAIIGLGIAIAIVVKENNKNKKPK